MELVKDTNDMETTNVKHLKIVERDPYLQPYEGALQARAEYAARKEAELTRGEGEKAKGERREAKDF